MHPHVLRYMAGYEGKLPRWYCECGQWRYLAKPVATSPTGNNKAEALRSFHVHEERAVIR